MYHLESQPVVKKLERELKTGAEAEATEEQTPMTCSVVFPARDDTTHGELDSYTSIIIQENASHRLAHGPI